MTWRESVLGDYMRIEHGFAFKGEYFSDKGKYILLTPGNFYEKGGFRSRPGKDRFYIGQFPEKYLLSKGDLIVAMTEQGEGLLGSAAIIPESSVYLHNQRLGLVRENQATVDRRFLYYLFNTTSVRDQIRNTSSGAKVRHTSPERIYSVKVRMPTKLAQQKIAAILSAYDDIIANNQRRITLLESMAEEIYREWFVRMRFPGYSDCEFRRGYPATWATFRVEQVCNIVKGKSYSGDDLSDDPTHMPFVTLKSFNRGGGYRIDGLKHYKGEFKNDQVVRKGDLVMAVTDMTQGREVVGQVARIPDFGDKGAVISLDVIKLEPIDVLPTFLYLYFRFSGFVNYIKEFANGANVLHLKSDLVGCQKVYFPPKLLQEQICALVNPLLDQAALLTIEMEKLASMRDSLLPRLISGKLKVNHLDIQFPPSMREDAAA